MGSMLSSSVTNFCARTRAAAVHLVTAVVGSKRSRAESREEIRILLRMDDCGYGRCRSEHIEDALTEAEITKSVVEIVERHNAKLTIGVIPNVHDHHPWLPSHGLLSSCPEEIRVLKQALASGSVEIAQHGYTHLSHAGQRSEFTGRSFDDQYSSIRKGKEEIEKTLNMRVHLFIPPWNKHDDNTLSVLTALGFNAISASQEDGENADIVYIRATTDLVEVLRALREAAKFDYSALLVVVFHGWEFLESGSPMAYTDLKTLDRLLEEIRKCPRVRFTSMGEEITLAREKGHADFSQRAYREYHDQVDRIGDILLLLGPLGHYLRNYLPSPGVMYPKSAMRKAKIKTVALEVILNVAVFSIICAFSFTGEKALFLHFRAYSLSAILISNGILIGIFFISDGVFGLVGVPGFGSRLTIAIVTLLGFLAGTIGVCLQSWR